jgi:rhodanese-related sulfurtransferase
VQELTPREVVERLKHRSDEGHPAPILLDVREDSEVRLCKIEGCLHVPMQAIPASLHLLPPDAEIIVYCHHGIRSRQVAHYLVRQGYATVDNLQGGIEAWACDVDPAMVRY